VFLNLSFNLLKFNFLISFFHSNFFSSGFSHRISILDLYFIKSGYKSKKSSWASQFLNAQHQLIKTLKCSCSPPAREELEVGFLNISFMNFIHFLLALSVTTQLATKIPCLSFRYSEFNHLSV